MSVESGQDHSAMNRPPLTRKKLPSHAREILNQSYVRTVICAFMGAYLSTFGLPNHPLYLAFVVYSIGILIWAYSLSERSTLVVAPFMLIDNAFTVLGLNVTGERGTFLLIFLIHISFGYGIRFGRKYLVGSLCVSCLGVTWLYLQSSPWRGQIHFLLSFLFGMPFISIYVYYLVGQARNSEMEAVRNAKQNQKLLTLLAHDIRTPLHTLLYSVEQLREIPDALFIRTPLDRMERIVNLMARMVTGVIASTKLHDAKHSDEDSGEISLNEWLVEFVELFREKIESEHAELIYNLDASYEYLVTSNKIHIERVLLNAISNASRFCNAGYIEIRTNISIGACNEIALEIINSFSPGSSKESTIGNNLETGNQQNQFHGAHLGIEAARSTADSMGGRFEFRKMSDTVFSARLIFPIKIRRYLMRRRSDIPVILVTSDAALGSSVEKSLSAFRSVYRFPSLKRITQIAQKHRSRISAILIEKSIENEEYERDFGNRHGPVVFLESRLDEDNKIIVSDGGIFVSKDGGQFTLAQSIAISEKIRGVSVFQNLERTRIGDLVQGTQVLAIDDSPFNLALLVAVLSAVRVRVETATTLEEARRLMTNKLFDVVIVDWNIGSETALEFLLEVDSGKFGFLPGVLILSSESLQGQDFRASNPSKLAILEKPVSNRKIIQSLDVLCSARNEEASNAELASDTQIFDAGIYFELLESGYPKLKIRELIEKFLSDFTEEYGALTELHARSDAQCVAQCTHKIMSICFAAGALALGDLFRLENALVRSFRDGNSVENMGYAAAVADTVELTKLHIELMLSSIEHT